ncbi:MAG: glycosyltransferase family 4 protein [Hyphomicrobiales bacterium]
MNHPVVRRLLFVLQSTASGGMETHVIDLAREFCRRGVAVGVVVPPGETLDSIAVRAHQAGARVYRVTTDARFGRSVQLREYRRFVALLRTFHPDVVHLHTGGATGGAGVVLAVRACTTATMVVTEHDVPAPEPGRGQRSARAVMDRLAHAIVAVSRRNARIRSERLPVANRNFAAILNGVPLPETSYGERIANRNLVRRELGIDPDAVVLGSLVRLAPGKGLDTLLHAFALVDTRPAPELLLVGDGPLREELRELACKLQVADRVRFAGNQPHPGPYLDAMDAFVLAVPAGSMSIALLEAMARGLPPVITFCGPEEAVIPGETGLGAGPNDPEDLARALATFAKNPDCRERLGEAAAAHVRRHFSVGRVASDLLDVYVQSRTGRIPEALHASAPANPRPGDRGR